MSQDDDLTLIQQITTKDRQAFETLYHRYYPRLFGYLSKVLKRQELVEEVLNDVMFVVWKDAERFSHKSRLSTWIFGIAYNKALKAMSRASEQPPDPDKLQLFWQEPEDPATTVSQQETRQVLTQALAALPPEQRSAIEFAFYHGLSYQEIAEIMDCPVNTVKTRMFHARKRLGDILPRLGLYRQEELR